MADHAPNAGAARLREEGNELYKRGKLTAAATKYEEASIATDGKDPLPYSNLSAVLFEIGKYSESIHVANKALELGHGLDQRMHQRLQTRILQASLHLGQLTALPGQRNWNFDPAVAATCVYMDRLHLEPDKPRLLALLDQALPRTKPALRRKPAWGRFGHDTFQSLYDDQLASIYALPADPNERRVPGFPPMPRLRGEDISLFWGGIGDARHLYTTWIELIPALMSPSDGGEPKFNFVINDYDPQVFARNLIVWDLLDLLARTKAEELMTKLISTIFYVFCAPIMPPQTYDHLQETIERCLNLMDGSAPLPKWLIVPDESRTPIIAALKTWQGEVPDLYDVSKFYVSMCAEVNRSGGFEPDRSRTRSHSKSIQTEYDCFTKTLLLLPHHSLLKQDVQLTQLYRQFVKKPHEYKKLRAHIAESWWVNPTLLSLEDELLQDNVGTMYPDTWRLLHQMYDACLVPPPDGCKSLFDYTTTFFKMLASSLELIRDKMTVYVSVGDIALTLEELRCPNYSIPPEMRPPKMFDRMHLSNIPDYLGMDLFAFTYATPLLKPHHAAFVTYNCLTCPPRWETRTLYTAESVLLHKSDELARALNVEFAGSWQRDEDCEGYNYFKWRRISTCPQKVEEILTRSDFNHWIYSIFLHLALPAIRFGDKHKWGWMPLGYPSHWLGQVLGDILSDKLMTTARSPQDCPVGLDQAMKRWPAQKLPATAFLAELSTLTAQFLQVLPFAVIVKDGVIPMAEAIRECTIRWTHGSEPAVAWKDAWRADFVLAFCKMDVYINAQHEYPDPEMRNARKLRQTLVHPELSGKVKGAVHIVTTWRWSTKENAATFWLREDVLTEMMKDQGGFGRRVEVWRTDDWLPQDDFRTPFAGRVEWTLGRRWSDVVKAGR